MLGPMRILLVEDDEAVAESMARALRSQSWSVDCTARGEPVPQSLRSDHYDLLILDIGLPGIDGLEVLRRLRARKSAVPVLMLTAFDTLADRVRGLDLGADDYLAKPFNPRELLARVNAVLRRSRGAQDHRAPRTGHRLTFEGWTLDTKRRELTNPDGVVIDLSTGEYDLLLSFLEAPQRVLTREQLLDAAKHRIATGFDRAIDVQVSRLRRKLDPSDESQAMIKTVRGTGYMFVAAVTRS